ncbi:MAG: hypothetical protein F6K42_33785 [Leptolyngbya sp. SIO1D8]|nr:hypothetical protein [Leptolyngbya sp. SIO1D8]
MTLPPKILPPNMFEFQDLYYYSNAADPYLFSYWPAQPTPEKDLQGEPIATLWFTGESAMLQLGVHWSVASEQLEALRQLLADQHPELTPALIRFSPAPAVVHNVVLALPHAEYEEILQTSTSAGYPPYAAVFQVLLSRAQASQVSAALQGHLGQLSVTYSLSLTMESQVKTRLQGDIAQDIAALLSPSELPNSEAPTLFESLLSWQQEAPPAADITFEDCRAQIEQAIAEQRLVLSRIEIGPISDTLRSQADHLVKEQAARVLLLRVQQSKLPPDESQIDVAARALEPSTLPLQSSTDVGTWFPDGSGFDHVHGLPLSESPESPEPPDTRTPVNAPPDEAQIDLDFIPEAEAIAFIQLSLGDEQTILRGPEFLPASLPMTHPVPDLVVKTQYRDGGPPYEVTLPAPSDACWKLTSADLGIVSVHVDGSAMQSTGAKQARIRVQYRPSGMGTPDDRTLYFRHDTWMNRWHIITRSPDLAGVLEVECKETSADSSITKHPKQLFFTPELTL